MTSPSTRPPGSPPVRPASPGLSGHLPPTPAHGRTLDRLDQPRPPPSALPRHRQERRLAAPARRRDQSPPAAHPGADPHRRHLDPHSRLTGDRPSGPDLRLGAGSTPAGRSTSLSNPCGCDSSAASTAIDDGLPALLLQQPPRRSGSAYSSSKSG